MSACHGCPPSASWYNLPSTLYLPQVQRVSAERDKQAQRATDLEKSRADLEKSRDDLEKSRADLEKSMREGGGALELRVAHGRYMAVT